MTIPRICEACGKEFLAKTTVTRFCSQACGKRFRRRGTTVIQKTKATKTADLESINKKEFLSIKEAHYLIGISEQTIRHQIQSQTIKATKLGRRIIIKRTDIDKHFAL